VSLRVVMEGWGTKVGMDRGPPGRHEMLAVTRRARSPFSSWR
jgi:hypothetical protein